MIRVDPERRRKKFTKKLRQVAVSLPCIGRRDVGSRLHVLHQHGRTKSRSQSAHISLAKGSARTCQGPSELSRVEGTWAAGTRPVEDPDHRNRCCFRQSERRLLEIRSTGWRKGKAHLSSLDKSRTTKTLGTDLVPFSRGSNNPAAALV